MTADPAAAYAALRDETAKMFDYDLASASLTQGLQIDLVSLLRLEVDTMQGKVLAGETVDLQRLVAAHGLLAKMLPQSALVAPAAAADHVDQFAGAREELRALFDRRAEAIERRDRRRDAEMARDPNKARAEARAEFEARLQAAIEKHCGTGNKSDNVVAFEDPAGGIARHDGAVPHPAPVEPAAAVSGCLPVLVSPAPPPPPPPRRSMDEINAEPANPPAREPEPWRKFVDSDGNIHSPWFRPHG